MCREHKVVALSCGPVVGGTPYRSALMVSSPVHTSWGSPSQGGRPTQEPATVRAKGLAAWWWRLEWLRLPSQQCQNALPFGVGGGAQPAVMAHALEAPGQHMLEKTSDELTGWESEGGPLLIGTVLVFEGDAARLILKNAL